VLSPSRARPGVAHEACVRGDQCGGVMVDVVEGRRGGGGRGCSVCLPACAPITELLSTTAPLLDSCPHTRWVPLEHSAPEFPWGLTTPPSHHHTRQVGGLPWCAPYGPSPVNAAFTVVVRTSLPPPPPCVMRPLRPVLCCACAATVHQYKPAAQVADMRLICKGLELNNADLLAAHVDFASSALCAAVVVAVGGGGSGWLWGQWVVVGAMRGGGNGCVCGNVGARWLCRCMMVCCRCVCMRWRGCVSV
jgi:hypothetical protein